jgi:transcriptional regulator with XRE-family HTH domain
VNGVDLREARRRREWTQAELADRLGVTQAYVCLLERGRRVLPAHLTSKLVSLMNLPPSRLPLRTSGGTLAGDEAPAALGALGYPGFAYVRGRRRLNPAELLLKVLRAEDVEARVVDALPWILVEYPDIDWPWLVREAKISDLQNRLGFLLTVARQVAELRSDERATETLAERERTLEGSRLVREDAFRTNMTEAERRWLRQNRPAHAAHWNMLSTMSGRELADAY